MKALESGGANDALDTRLGEVRTTQIFVLMSYSTVILWLHGFLFVGYKYICFRCRPYPSNLLPGLVS